MLFNLDISLCDDITKMNMEHIKGCKQCRHTVVSLSKTAMVQTILYRFVTKDKVTEFMEYLQTLERIDNA